MTYKDIRVAWSRRHSPKAAPTTDLEGYHLMEFSFVDGDRVTAMVRNDDGTRASSWQKELFKTQPYLTNVEIWHSKDQTQCFVYAEPSAEIKELLPE